MSRKTLRDSSREISPAGALLMLIGLSEPWRAAPIVQICAERVVLSRSGRRTRGGSARGYLHRASRRGRRAAPATAPTYGHRVQIYLVTGSKYLYIAIMKAVVRFCRG